MSFISDLKPVDGGSLDIPLSDKKIKDIEEMIQKHKHEIINEGSKYMERVSQSVDDFEEMFSENKEVI